MVPIAALLVPIVVSAVLVHLVSAVIHMALKYHRGDYGRLPDEEGFRKVLLAALPAPGQYMFPYCADHSELKTPEMMKKREQGPVGIVTFLRPSAAVNMGKFLGQWFVYCLVVSFFTAYLTGHVLAAGTPYLEVFRVAGTFAFGAYGLATVQQSIWMGKPWSTTAKDLFDALIYASFTAGAFGWRWPHAM
jgi:hypothetical protein